MSTTKNRAGKAMKKATKKPKVASKKATKKPKVASKKAAPKKAPPKKAPPKKAPPKKAPPKKAASKKAAPKKAAPKKVAPKKVASKKAATKRAKRSEVAPTPRRRLPETITLPPEVVDVVDVAIEQNILHNAPLDLEAGEPEHGMTPRYLAHLGGALARRERWLDAAHAWSRIPSDHSLAGVTRPWRALALAKAGRLDEALTLAPEGSHLAGELHCALGRLDEGLAIMANDRSDAEQVEWRILRQATWLRRAGRAEEGARLLGERLETIARFDDHLRIEAMRSWLEVGSREQAAAHFEGLSSDGLALRVTGQGLVGLEWLPHGLGALAREAAQRGVPIDFLDEPTAREARSALELGPSPALGVLPGAGMWEALGEGAEYVVVAESMARPSRTAYAGSSVALWLVHPARPGKLYLCLSPKIPAFLWHEIDAELDEVRALLARVGERLVVDEPRLRDLPERHRVFVGSSAVPSPYTGELEDMDFHTFGRVAVSSPFLEAYGWGGAHEEDPHRLFVDRGRLDGMFALRETSGQHRERPMMESYRTRHSRSIFTLERHPVGFVLEVRHRATSEAERARVRSINARFGTSFPEGLPLDGVGLLMHFDGALDAAALAASLGTDAVLSEPWRALALAALSHESVTLDGHLAPLPDAVAKAGDEAAWIYNHLGHLLRRALARDELREPLQTGPGPSVLRPNDEDDEYDEDDEDDEDDDSEEDDS